MLSGSVSDEVIEWARSVSKQAGLNATLGRAKAFATTDFRPDLAAFKVPTLILHGTGDKTVPIDASGRAAAKGIAQSTLIEYDGAPHGLQASHKERLTKDLLDFIRS
jgi:non-heme chloroperoxidase